MEIEQILPQLTNIFRNVLDNDSIQLKKETTANDVEEWDSLTHIQLIVSIEKHFRIRSTASEIKNFKNIGELCDAIKAKTV